MNTRPPIEAPNEPAVLSVAFNDDASRFSVGLNSGFCIFHAPTCQLQATKDFNAGIALVQMMGKSNFLALVGGGRAPKFPQNKVIVWDDSKSKVALEITTLTAVRGVQLSRSRVVVVLQNSVRVYGFTKRPDPKTKYETADNLLGLCCLSADDKYLVFPGRTAGQVQVVDLRTENVSIIPAHNSKLQALALSADGELLATASEKGTIVRVFATSSCAKIAERRRGSEFAAIYSLRFSPSGRMLACTSAKGSLHIFDTPRKGVPSSPARNAVSTGTPPHSPAIGILNTGGNATTTDPTNKWGFLSNIPWGPFSDVYSFASTRFEAGDEPESGSPSSEAVLGTSRPVKGIIGWIDDDSLIVVGAGRDARWEKFVLVDGEEGHKVLVREGWKRYLGN
ncbi:WD40-repeat-containing domain protein [Pseudomassariella vexata]|uniref:WD40-repeat-containing domain protein n=1 Tax=Pseudomassariella vexata TaxID=1141098 RepID=A0A1Y2E884_9PEZI|nr:WD40-repeat-containing domain protein [Pseudomassariella vexata]ORY67783.1 WD40-repeat-containing domain protein [Pseudomassariella vexata]